MSKTPSFLLYFAVLLAGVTGCPGDGVTPPTPGVQTVSVAPSGASIKVGATVQMTASVTADVGVATTVTWSSPTLSIATVGAGTGLVTGVGAGTVSIQACSTVSGFTTVCGSAPVTVTALIPASVELTGATWIPPAGPTGCAPGAGPAVPIGPTTLVRCLIDIGVRFDPGDQQIQRIDVSIGSRVVGTITGSAIRGGPEEADGAGSISPAPIVVTLSTNTAQLRKNGGILVPVVFNGNQSITANLYVLGSSSPIASTPIPVVMGNQDAMVIEPILSLIPIAQSPSVTDDAGNIWFGGGQTVTGMNYVAFGTAVPVSVAINGSLCGNATSTLTGTGATGIVYSGSFACTNVEGLNRVSGLGPVTYGTANGPDGTPLVAPTVVSAIGTAFQVPIDAAGTLDSRWNMLASAPSTAFDDDEYVDNKGPVVTINRIAFNPAPGAPWINPSYDLVGRVGASDGGPVVGSKSTLFAGAGLINQGVCGPPLPSPHGLAESSADFYQVCGRATDQLGHIGVSGPSNTFGVETTPFGTAFSTFWNHASGIPGVSFLCPLITLTPSRPGGIIVVTASGPGVVAGQGTSTVTVAADGTARPVIQINLPATYSLGVNATSPGGFQQSGTHSAPVGAGANSCP